MSERVLIFDTTLRDGEQSPGCSMSLAEKSRMAHTLRDLGVDVIEAGFAASSPEDRAAVAHIAHAVRGVRIATLARCVQEDVELAMAALEHAEAPRLHLFLASSDIHLEHKLRMSREEAVCTAAHHVRLARTLCDDVEFSAEDASRSEPAFLVRLFSEVIAAGATTINVPDTVGYADPASYGALFALLRREVPGADRVVWSTHCHDDLGLAVANTLAGLEHGARQVECTLNGIGERAGNAALEEVVMALRVHHRRYRLECGVNTRRLYPASRELAAITGSLVARNKAIVGDNAFAHEAGIHQHGMLRHRETYEIIDPEDVGVPGSTMVLGKHSGRAALRTRLAGLGYSPDDAALNRAFVAFKRLADTQREVDDKDLDRLMRHLQTAERVS